MDGSSIKIVQSSRPPSQPRDDEKTREATEEVIREAGFQQLAERRAANYGKS